MELSNREKNIMVELGIDIIAAIWYFSAYLILSGDSPATLGDLAGTALQIIIFAVIAGAGLTLWVNRGKDPEAADERDKEIAATGYKIGYFCFMGLSVALAGHYLIATTLVGAEPFAEITPLLAVNLILGMVVVASTAKSVTQLALYRRGY